MKAPFSFTLMFLALPFALAERISLSRETTSSELSAKEHQSVEDVAKAAGEAVRDAAHHQAYRPPMEGKAGLDDAGFIGDLVHSAVHKKEDAVSGESCSMVDCSWTEEYTCPGQPTTAGAKGTADDDGSLGFSCCCAHGMWNLEEPRWIAIDGSKACESNNEDIPRMDGSDYLPDGERSVRHCKRKCDHTPFCHAIDYFAETGWCNLFEVACDEPLKEGQGSSSYRKSEYIMKDEGLGARRRRREITEYKSKACEENTEHITRIFQGDLHGGFEACKVRCLESSLCSAMDYFDSTGYCNLYEVPCREPQLSKDGAHSFKRVPEADWWLSPVIPAIPPKFSCVVGVFNSGQVCLEATNLIDQVPFQAICRGVQVADATGASGPAVQMVSDVQGTQCPEGPRGGQGHDCSANNLQECVARAFQANNIQKAFIMSLHIYVAKVVGICPTNFDPCAAYDAANGLTR